MPMERIAPQSEVIRAILLEDSPCCEGLIMSRYGGERRCLDRYLQFHRWAFGTFGAGGGQQNASLAESRCREWRLLPVPSLLNASCGNEPSGLLLPLYWPR